MNLREQWGETLKQEFTDYLDGFVLPLCPYKECAFKTPILGRCSKLRGECLLVSRADRLYRGFSASKVGLAVKGGVEPARVPAT